MDSASSSKLMVALPPGASADTAIALAKPTNTPEVVEVLTHWIKASVPQSMAEYYGSAGVDPDTLRDYKRFVDECPDRAEENDRMYKNTVDVQLKYMLSLLEAGEVVFVLHNSKPINGNIIDITGMKKQLSLFSEREYNHFALATLDTRTQTMTQAVAQLFSMFKKDFTLEEKKI